MPVELTVLGFPPTPEQKRFPFYALATSASGRRRHWQSYLLTEMQCLVMLLVLGQGHKLLVYKRLQTFLLLLWRDTERQDRVRVFKFWLEQILLITHWM